MNRQYDKMMYESGPISFYDYASNKQDKIHCQLYRNALQKYLVDHQNYLLYRTAYNFIEIKGEEYWMPSYVNIVMKHYPYTRNKVWLNDYWDDYQKKISNRSPYDIMIDDATMNDAQIVDINYATGEATLKSKYTGVEVKVPFDRLNSETEVSDSFINDNEFTNLTR